MYKIIGLSDTRGNEKDPLPIVQHSATISCDILSLLVWRDMYERSVGNPSLCSYSIYKHP